MLLYLYREADLIMKNNFNNNISIDELVEKTTGISLEDTNFLDGGIDRNEFNRAMRTATRIISRSYPSEQMLREKLYKKYTTETSDYVVSRLVDSQVVNDFDLAYLILDEGLIFKRYGTRRIKEMMVTKKVPNSIISEALNYVDSETLFENALYHAKQKIKTTEGEDKFSLQKKLSNYLIYRGFDYSTVYRVIDCLLSEGDNI